jgi:Transposase domain (DUF772)
MKQMTLAAAGFEGYAKTTRRTVFEAEMERVVSWPALCGLIEPFYPKAGNGRPPVGVERRLRICFLQQWFNLSDLAVEEALYDSLAMRDFAGIDLGREPVPDETTVCRFRHLLETHDLDRQLRRGAAASDGQGTEGGHRHDRGCYDHQCARVDQERQEGARSRNAPDPEGQPVVFRHEGANRHRAPEQIPAGRGRYALNYTRVHPVPAPDVMARGST